MDYPHYLICANIDITNFLAQTKNKRLPFYYAMIYAATFALNQNAEFKYRIRGEEIVVHDIIHPSFSDLAEGSELFKLVTVSMPEDIDDFIESTSKKSSAQIDYFPVASLPAAMI